MPLGKNGGREKFGEGDLAKIGGGMFFKFWEGNFFVKKRGI